MKRIGKFEIIREISSNKFDVIYLGKDTVTGLESAIKVFRAADIINDQMSIAAQKKQIKSFLKEVRHLRKLAKNSNIPNLLGFGEITENTPWYATEYFEKNLRHKIGLDISNRDRLAKTSKDERPKSLNLETSLIILKDILEALTAYHAQDMIHGNLRPEVIICNENSPLKLALFASVPIAANIDRYQAPECHDNPDGTDQRADIYSFAVLCYRLLTGKIPAGRYKDPDYYVPDISPILNNLILDSLAEQPNERPYNSVELLIKLKACFDEQFNEKTDINEQEQSDDEPEVQLVFMKPVSKETSSKNNKKMPLIEKLQAKEDKINHSKEELQNLKKQIIRIFRGNGTIPDQQWNNLIPIGIINGLDTKALNELISHLKTQHKEDIEPAINFVKSIDQHLLESHFSIPQKTLESLEQKALEISWNKEHLATIITDRSNILKPKQDALIKLDNMSPENNKNSEKTEKSPKEPTLKAVRKPALEPKSSSIFWPSVGIIILGIGTFFAAYYYNMFTPAPSHLPQQEASSIKEPSPLQAKTDEIDKQAKINNAITPQAGKALIEPSPSLAAPLFETKETITKIQKWFSLIGYSTKETGELDQATQQAMTKYQNENDLALEESLTEAFYNHLKNDLIAREERDWAKALKKQTIYSHNLYLKKWPEGSYRKEAVKFVSVMRQVLAFRNARKANDVTIYKEYLRKHPKGYRINFIIKRLAEKEKSDWLTAQEIHRASSYQVYLENWPSGRYSAEAEKKIPIARDTAAFRQAINANSKIAFEEYKNNFPNGAYLEQADGNLTRLDMEEEKRLIEQQRLEEKHRNTIQIKDELKRLGYENIGISNDHVNQGFTTALKHFERSLNQLENAAITTDIISALRTTRIKPLLLGDVFKDCDDCPSMVFIRGGEKLPLINNAPQAIPMQNFAVGQFEITKAQFSVFSSATNYEINDDCYVYQDGDWDDIKDTNWQNPGYKQTNDHPVTCVNINDAIAYIRWISTKTGQKYRLLSEAEWGYMAGINNGEDYSFGTATGNICQYGNGADQAADFKWSNPDCDDGFSLQTSPVGSFLANAFNIYDTLGNVSEIVRDCWDDGFIPPYGTGVSPWLDGGDDDKICRYHTLRGGSWMSDPKDLKTRHRVKSQRSSRRYNITGFRIAKSVN